MDEGSLSRGGGNFVLSELELVQLKTENIETPVKLQSAHWRILLKEVLKLRKQSTVKTTLAGPWTVKTRKKHAAC
jgi:hypothetical protein